MNIQIERNQQNRNGSEVDLRRTLDSLECGAEREEYSVRNYTLRCPIFSNVGKLEANIEQYLFTVQRGQNAMNADTSSISSFAKSITGVSEKSCVLYLRRNGFREMELAAKGTYSDFYQIESFLNQNGYSIKNGKVVDKAIASFNLTRVREAEDFQTCLNELCAKRRVSINSVRSLNEMTPGYTVQGMLTGEVESVLQIVKFLNKNGWGTKVKSIEIQFENAEATK